MSAIRETSEDEVYRVRGSDEEFPARHADRFDLRFVPMDQLSNLDWEGVKALAGGFSTCYLRMAYGSKRTALLLVMEAAQVVAVLWVVPGDRIRKRYPFVDTSNGTIISCVTHPSYRGLGLYPAGIRAVAASGHSREYFIWAHKSNMPSLIGIQRAGGEKIGEFTRVRWFRGLFSSVFFRSMPVVSERHG